MRRNMRNDLMISSLHMFILEAHLCLCMFVRSLRADSEAATKDKYIGETEPTAA